jgi:hypothetical protein
MQTLVQTQVNGSVAVKQYHMRCRPAASALRCEGDWWLLATVVATAANTATTSRHRRPHRSDRGLHADAARVRPPTFTPHGSSASSQLGSWQSP